uniref:BBP1_C domain-containing protein n=1 Tax=Rhabditophanes sp. KR3021 TaxID=114890 RepID=A0AC35UGL1_9BILA
MYKLLHIFKTKKPKHKENEKLSDSYDPDLTLKEYESDEQYINDTAAYHTNKKKPFHKLGPSSCPSKYSDLYNQSCSRSRSKKSNDYVKNVDYSEEKLQHKKYGKSRYDAEYEDDLLRAERHIRNLEKNCALYKKRYYDALEDTKYFKSLYTTLKMNSQINEDNNLKIKIKRIHKENKELHRKLDKLETTIQNNFTGNSILFPSFGMDNSYFKRNNSLHQEDVSTSSMTSISDLGITKSKQLFSSDRTSFRHEPSLGLLEDDQKDEIKNFRTFNDDSSIEYNRSPDEGMHTSLATLTDCNISILYEENEVDDERNSVIEVKNISNIQKFAF